LGLACLRKRWFGWHFWRLAYRLRGQARSHRGYLVSLFFEPGANSNVGTGLPAKAVVRLAFLATGIPPSRVSPLPQGIPGGPVFEPGANSNVGAGLPAKGWVSRHFWRLVYRLRGQARSHRGYLVSLFFEPGANSNVGAGLPAKAVVRLAFLATGTALSQSS
jgi:hypothetical protein